MVANVVVVSALLLQICGLSSGLVLRQTLVASVTDKLYTFEKSAKIFAEAKTLMPGGVSSPVRAFKSVGGEPIVFDRVKGAYAWDVDGNKYIDYVGTWGPAIVGHANDEVLDSLRETLVKGTSFGAPGPLENVLAKMVIAAVPSVEMVRFTNSGTEACMGMLRLVRAFTGRDAIIKFDGCYHGHADSFLVQAGSGVATLGLPDSPGVPQGGGLPVGAYGGRKDIMSLVAPAGPMYQAGTLSGNPLAMAAGIKTMEILSRPNSYQHLEKITSRLISGILAAGKEYGHAVTGGSISGMFGFFFTEGPVNNFSDASKSDLKKFARWHRMMLERGVYLAPSQYEAGFTSLAHTEEDIDKTLEIVREVMSKL
eukprot:gene28063-36950_t